jgi:hypothetical protein
MLPRRRGSDFYSAVWPIFFDTVGAWPVVSGADSVAFGTVAVGDRYGVEGGFDRFKNEPMVRGSHTPIHHVVLLPSPRFNE